ncbi:MAG: DUF1565 domain-containing protein, partial [Bacteroidales bacterium]|nr:DUF1565 domain-containing protein [Bacteroidales bacterium]
MLLKPIILLPLFISFLCVITGVSQVNHDVHPLWENTTSYTKTYYVDQRHVNASDSNSGSRLLPFRTIGPAIKAVKAGERVLVHRGIYREAIELEQGGSAPDKMIMIESAKGHEVIIKGSIVLSNLWVRSVKPGRKAPKPSVTNSRSKRLWITQIDESMFSESFNPMFEKNLKESNSVLSKKGVDLENTAPFNLSRVLLFQNNKRMVQL